MNLKILVPVALITIGAGLYGLSGKLMKQEVEPALVDVAEPVKMLGIWQVNQDVKAGQMVAREQLKRIQVSESDANKKGVSENVELHIVKGMVASRNLVSGAWVMPSDFVTPEQDGYVGLIIAKNKVPYGIRVDSDTIIGGVITHGSLIDVIALSSVDQNLAASDRVQPIRTVYLSPILIAVKVLKVETKPQDSEMEVSLVLELSRKELAKLVIAKKISQLEFHKSVGPEQAEFLQANSGDILPTYQAIKEFRAGEANTK